MIRNLGLWKNSKFINHFNRKWSNVVAMPPDAILGLSDAFKKDQNPNKINLTIGAYRDDNGQPYVLDVVKKAEKMILAENTNKEYPPLSGFPDFRQKAAVIAFGEDSNVIRNNLNCTFQSVSGTGALRLGAEFLMMNWPLKKEIFLPNPSWANHSGIFSKVGMKVSSYRYYDRHTNNLDFEGMMADLQALDDGSIVLLHACAHNPTGVDPTMDQWKAILDVLSKKNCCLFFDMAYQGYATGDLAFDAAAVRYLTNQANSGGCSVLLAQSFSKNMGLYGERTGTLTVVCNSEEEKEGVMSNLLFIGRRLCSFPPIHGAKIASKILNNQELMNLWCEEVKGMANRVLRMRKMIVSKMGEYGSSRDWSHVERQIGMFCFTGIEKKYVEILRDKYSIYMTNDGRISVTGLNTGNIDYFVKAVKDVTQ